VQGVFLPVQKISTFTRTKTSLPFASSGMIAPFGRNEKKINNDKKK